MQKELDKKDTCSLKKEKDTSLHNHLNKFNKLVY